jgi:hypothetical protein
MMTKRTVLVFVLALAVLALDAGHGFSQAKGPAGVAKAEMETVKGTIDFNERLGGYFIRGEEPGGEFFIVNQNKKVLKKLKESGDSVTIEGYTTSKGAEYFSIKKIGGKKYSTAQAGKKKGATK